MPPLRTTLVCAFLLAGIRGALAAPLPAAEPASLPAITSTPTSSLESACGTRPGAVADVLRQHFARALPSPAKVMPHSTDAGEIAVLEDDGTFFFDDKNGNENVDYAAVANAFYLTHADLYDAIAIYLSTGHTAWHGSPTAIAECFVVRNQIQGIGLTTFDVGGAFGSPSRLEAVLSMNGMSKWPMSPDSVAVEGDFTSVDILAHELGHRWLAYAAVESAGVRTWALSGRDHAHWGFFYDNDGSFMEGCGWTRVGADSFRTNEISTRYGPLDLYLMGLADASEIDSFFVVNNPTALDPPGTYVPGTPAALNVGCHGRATWWNVGDVQATMGVRVPNAAAAPHHFRVAVILVTSNGQGATAADLSKLEAIRSRFGSAFGPATAGRGSMDVTIDHHAGHVRIAHRPLPDTENSSAQRTIGARITIEQGGIPIAVDPSSVRVFWRPVGNPSWTSIPMLMAAPDSFASSLPGLGSVGDAGYYLYAASDSSGIDAYEPPAGAVAPHVYHTGPDVIPPVIAHVPVQFQAAARMPQTVLAHITDNLAVDTAWVEVSINGGAPTTIAPVPAGRDSFAANIGAGLVEGDRIAYRFVARDRAAAHNFAYSPITTLYVGRSWFDDFENGASGWSHGSQWYSYRDAWHFTTETSSPDGGTAWKCGGGDSDTYPPHLDAVLDSPVIASLAPGSTLRFDHRYDLEAEDSVNADDGGRVEGYVNGDWVPLIPAGGYNHHFFVNSNPFQAGAPCWSGNSGGWHSEVMDLSPLGAGPTQIRFRMLADDLIGRGGWWVDRIRLIAPGSATDAAPPVRLSIGSPWPNPSRGALHLVLALPRAARVTWTLHDVAGRRVAVLWRGNVGAGSRALDAEVAALPAGLYFARLTLDGREAAVSRVVRVR